MEEFIVRSQIEVRSSKSTVWKALTIPDLTKRYFFNSRLLSSWIVDEPIVFKSKILGLIPVEMRGKLLKIDRGNMINYSLKHRDGSGESVVEIDLYQEKDKTIVTVTDNVGTTDGAEKRYTKSVKGWEKILHGLKRVVETEMN